MQECEKVLGCLISEKWQAFPVREKQPKDKTKPAETGSRIITIDNEGVTSNVAEAILEENGFKLDDIIVQKKDREKSKVVKIKDIGQDGNIEGCVRSDDGEFDESDADKTCIIELSELQEKKWTHYKAADPDKFVDMELHEPYFHKTAQIQAITAMVTLQVAKETTAQHGSERSVKVGFAPKKQVIATKDFAKGELTLIPSTISVNSKKDDGKVEATQVGLMQVVKADGQLGDTMKIVLGNTTVLLEDGNEKKKDGFVAPFWFVQPAKDANFNMAIHSRPLQHLKVDRDFSIPKMVNVKAIKKGDVLLVAKEGGIIGPGCLSATPASQIPESSARQSGKPSKSAPKKRSSPAAAKVQQPKRKKADK